MRTREQLEQVELTILASYAMASVRSRGRDYPEAEAPYRTVFQRDRERVLHTTAFRRLQGKTQVFVVTEGDYYRTRITHTLEVAQIGRTIARALGANEDLVEGICLAHDLGHPPFGHAGERTLNALMAGHDGFDHNRQSFRIITELEQRYPDFPGLNLSYEFREGIVKHETEYDVAVVPEQYAPDLRGTLEAQIASLADELAYNAHDLDDGLRAGLLTEADVVNVGWWQRASEAANVGGSAFSDATRHRVVRKLIGSVVTDLLDETTRRIQRMRGAGGESVEDVRRWPEALVGYSDGVSALNRELKSFLYEHLYFHPRVIRMTSKAERVLTDLFNVYVAEPRMLGTQARKRLEGLSLQRVVCDYIAGMTDRFALDEHARLFDPHERV
jgi:dGTPase